MERIVVAFVIVSFALTSMIVLVESGNPLSREEAIEISRNTELVQKRMEEADRYTFEIRHFNQTQIEKIVEQYPYRREWYPEDHGAWDITWYFHPEGAASAVARVVSHTIDDETGEILFEEGVLVLR